jgi:hypothetical protein
MTANLDAIDRLAEMVRRDEELSATTLALASMVLQLQRLRQLAVAMRYSPSCTLPPNDRPDRSI